MHDDDLERFEGAWVEVLRSRGRMPQRLAPQELPDDEAARAFEPGAYRAGRRVNVEKSHDQAGIVHAYPRAPALGIDRKRRPASATVVDPGRERRKAGAPLVAIA
jgi:hypothetical protein